ncbi:DNA cytosine methyltransferase [Streptomyces chattanoogensis]|uniref:DNA cytosine methyltransferase n=1 Tax=Streptomyces chattanoogensis TaxID=66876 RepID=UPI00367B803D
MLRTFIRGDLDLDFTDLFCGAGGSSTGLVEAGYILKLAANHDPVSIRTHMANHPMAEHLCVDLNSYAKRRLPRTRALWGSPICTEIAPCGGRKRTYGQLALDIDGEGAAPRTFERTRATAHDIISAVEVHRYDVVICENVIEFGTDWELFDWWLKGMAILGYNYQIVCASSAHLGGGDNLLAPQLRDRLYIVFTRKGIPLPDLTVRPEAVCPECGPVLANQVWDVPGPRNIGKWAGANAKDPRSAPPRHRTADPRERRYTFRCPNRSCGHLVLIPTTRPVEEIIDWDLQGTRVGDGRPDRKTFTPYADSTKARIAQGLAMFGGNPHIAMLRRNGTPVPLTQPVPVLNAKGRHHALIIPNGRKGAPRTTTEPLTTVATKQHHALVRMAQEVDNCTLRMLSTGELKQAQRLPVDYILHGTQAEQILQVGNAVSVNAARWIGERVRAVLN